MCLNSRMRFRMVNDLPFCDWVLSPQCICQTFLNPKKRAISLDVLLTLHTIFFLFYLSGIGTPDPSISIVDASGWNTCPNDLRYFKNYFGLPPEFLQALPLTVWPRHSTPFRTVLVSHYGGWYPQVYLEIQQSEPFIVVMEGVVFKLFLLFYIA